MARPLRLLIPGGIYHVRARGNSRAAVYRDDRDRRAFLELFERVVDRFGWICQELPGSGLALTQSRVDLARRLDHILQDRDQVLH